MGGKKKINGVSLNSELLIVELWCKLFSFLASLLIEMNAFYFLLEKFF